MTEPVLVLHRKPPPPPKRVRSVPFRPWHIEEIAKAKKNPRDRVGTPPPGEWWAEYGGVASSFAWGDRIIASAGIRPVRTDNIRWGDPSSPDFKLGDGFGWFVISDQISQIEHRELIWSLRGFFGGELRKRVEMRVPKDAPDSERLAREINFKLANPTAGEDATGRACALYVREN